MANKGQAIHFVGEKFGQKRPPLSVTIKQILERYPDGQIFKEMIQNADDAGAKRVQFYIDSRTHGTHSLVHDDLAPFQGPALLSVNDAIFSENDWKGIQSLQQSVKAEDPFKVGRFGIGFNSVYHLTDVPVIISGEKVAYLEPQQRIWTSESGRSFTVSELQGTDNLTPFDGISDFKSSDMTSYPKTIFRFPMRRTPSEMSENLYDVPKVRKLIDALREEAKLLLVFLRSIDTIEVHEISQDGTQELCFKTEVSEKHKSSLGRKRKRMMDKLRSAYSSKSYDISNLVEFTAKFSIKVSGVGLKEEESHWLVCNQVGSEKKEIVEAAAKQKVFPWVGTALELDRIPESGRIYCFLPMPIEAASNLPVHINGTFGLTDDRRSLKWPGIERKNDPTADWNKMLVREVLPRCYVTLLSEANSHLNFELFYKVWPDEKALRRDTWGELLKPLYTTLFDDHPVFWSKVPKKEGEWIEARHGAFVQKATTLDIVIQQSLVSCGVRVVSIPPNVWAALNLAGIQVKEITPKLVRNKLKDNTRYTNLGRREKCVILDYCLSDKQYYEMLDMHLLPLFSGNFTQFQSGSIKGVTKVYVTSELYPSDLLPNLSHILVDLTKEHPTLHDKLLMLAEAKSKVTQVRPLMDGVVAELLEQAMPASWKRSEFVSLPASGFSREWFELFWKWVEARKLKTFVGRFVLPVSSRPSTTAECPSPSSFSAIKLTPSQAVVYVPSGQRCSGALLASLERLEVSLCHQDDFPFVQHKHLKTYVKPFDTNGLLDAIASAPNYSKVKLSSSEAAALRDFLNPSVLASNPKRVATLEKLGIFTTAKNTDGQLMSFEQVRSVSTLKKAIAAPSGSCLDISKLPASLVMFSQIETDQYQKQLLQKLNVEFPSDCVFIVDYVFPMIHNKSIPDALLDEIMVRILDAFHALIYDHKEIISGIKNLPFVRTSTSSGGGRKCPKELFDPRDTQIVKVFKRELKFPISPYDEAKYLDVLKQCGLKTVIEQDEILDIVRSIGISPSSRPQHVDQTKLTRATAILSYICDKEFLEHLPSEERFSQALAELSRSKSWLPVLGSPPRSYPPGLKWKGSDYPFHVMSLKAEPYHITRTSDLNTVPQLVGSQVLLSYPPLEPSVARMLLPCDSVTTRHITAHLLEVIECSTNNEHVKESIPQVLRHIYRELTTFNDKESFSFDPFNSEWLYIDKPHQFVKPSVVALEKNPTFRYDLEPYIYLLPGTFADYKKLFLQFGMHQQVSQQQIVSVLSKIRDELSQGKLTVSLKEASDLVHNILNWLTDSSCKDVSDLVQSSDVYVPVDSDTGGLQLENARDVIYCDSDFMKEFASSESETKLVFSHSFIHHKMAECLGLRLLSEEMDISEDAFEDTGQQEPLTARLKTILKEYKDGLTIIKELLQNADDAEAQEFNICFDNRNHKVKKERLLFQGMSQAHGPALVIHNDKMFSADDFVNITKLAGATKEKKQLKIGKFGVGFCSVYHMTDVPSFVSRDLLHIFDPTLLCLGKVVKDLSKPGKKVKFTQKMISHSEQLNPFVGLFGFKKDRSYDGTLFRLPFRTGASELSSKCYREDTILELLGDLRRCSSKLLLFLQHVKHITFQRIDNGQEKPTVLFEVTKSSVPVPLPEQVHLMKFNSTGNSPEHWLIAHNQTELTGKHATASVACSLSSHSSSTYSVDRVDGEVFCFLPLSQKPGLPLHVSGNFAVINNRRGIWTSDEVNDKADSEVLWNLDMMRHVIPTAYRYLLVSLQRMFSQDLLAEYSFHDLWPLKSELKINNPWAELLEPLYEQISENELFLSTTSKWLTLRSCKVLEPGILCPPTESATPECVLDILTHLNTPLVDLPLRYQEHLALKGILITEEKFVKLFFSKLAQLKKMKEERNEVIQNLLEIYAMEYDDGTKRSYFLHEYLKDKVCIPSTPDGAVLRKCKEMIRPESPYAGLFDKSDGRFPDEKIASRHLSHTAFDHLGMLYKKIPCEMLVERAKTVIELMKANRTKALHRVRLILSCLDLLEDHLPRQEQSLSSRFSSIPFLPVVPKPEDYPIKWKGDGVELSSGQNLTYTGKTDSRYSDRNNMIIAGSRILFVNENLPNAGGCGPISHHVRQILQIRAYPTCAEVVSQLNSLTKIPHSKTNSGMIDKMCSQIYQFLDGEINYSHTNNKPVFDFSEMKRMKCIWTGTQFIDISQVAKKWNLNGPYLYQVPPILLSQESLCSALQIRENFSQRDVISTLKIMGDKFGERPIDEIHRTLFEALLPLLYNIKPPQYSTDFKILLPDQDFILRWSNTLAYNDAEWAPHDEKYTYVNDNISSSLAKQLLIKPVSSEVLEKYVMKEKSFFDGIEFGQREELTLRIHNILRDYSFDITILKELLQNADDAKATKMYVILDKRHHAKEKVFSEKWKKLQGPALLVWNDSTFSDRDLEGIQKLGLGSKRKDHESIGQYGIGFNAVYHLTDCPSFVTDGDTLCILDPHCHFIPGSTMRAPGRMISGKIWEKYPDINSAYLRNKLGEFPSEMQGGSLFRFPLRYSEELVAMSEIIQADEQTDKSFVVNAETMHSHIKRWAPKMKNAMFFLNHIKELKFCVIEENSSDIVTQYHYKTHVDEDTQKKREILHGKVSHFTNVSGNEGYLIHYPLTLTDLSSGLSGDSESWIIQQGVGDINNSDQTWKFVNQVKPKHGLAAPLKPFAKSARSPISTDLTPPFESQRSRFKGQVFCFLPIPSIESQLPVHVNGNFILNSTRLNMWYKKDPDDETKWNANLIRAIGSSYKKFLVHIRQYFFPLDSYKSWPPLLDAIHGYYSTFPRIDWSSLDKQWQSLSDDVYAKLVEANAQIMIIVNSEHVESASSSSAERSILKVCWHSCTVHSSSQIYFWKSREGMRDSDPKVIRPILENLDMKITSAPLRLMDLLNEALKRTERQELVPVSPKTVYSHYTDNYKQSSLSEFPCSISATAFHSVASFKEFTLYILSSSMFFRCFPSPPFGHPLLLTEDGLLRCFDEENKVLSSKFSSLFPRSRHKFLHQQMLEISYTNDYFAASLDRTKGLKVIVEVLSSSLPEVLFSCTKVNNSEDIVCKSALKKLWECFATDPMFKCYRSDITNVCAIIPSTNDNLFSLKNHIQPIVPDKAGDYTKITEVLRSIDMPFADTAIMSIEANCPSLSDLSRVLKNLFHLSQENVGLTALMNEARVSVIIDHIRAIDFRYNQELQKFAMSIPLYETMDGKFTNIYLKTVYKWPSGMCGKAYSKWSNQYATVTFLKPTAAWNLLCSADLLNIKNITAEEVYVEYVFKQFSLFTDEERYIHLKHIRDKLYDDNKYYKDGTRMYSQRHANATKFITALCDLRCLKAEDNTLRRANEFCDHKQVIFKIFSQKFRFLPSIFRDGDDTEKWMEFFIELGLKQTVTKDEFLNFCKEVASGKHNRLSEASSILVRHLLFSEAAKKDEWHCDDIFLSNLSRISFVLVEKMEPLNWIVKQANPAVTHMQHNCYIQLASPSQSATSECSSLLWTVKPIIDLHLPLFPTPESRAIVKGLMVTENATADSDDIIANIRNVCRSSTFANFSLFDTYSDDLRPPEGVKSLMDVMLEMFQRLLTMEIDSEHLSSLPCIPVYSTPKPTSKWQLVLVKPCYVVISSSEVEKFHPYLYNLPDTLMPVLPLLMKLGVKNRIDLGHIQAILKAAYTQAEQERLEVNTKNCVVGALKDLKVLLQDKKKKDSNELEMHLVPLYLPTSEGKLHLSTDLMYSDTSAYRGKLDLNLQDTPLAQLQIRPYEYGFTDSDLCELLPEGIRPNKMSKLCEQQIVSLCDEVHDSAITSKIKETLKVSLLSEAALKIVIQYLKVDDIGEKVKPFIHTFLENIRVLTVRNLKTSIKFKSTGNEIGKAKIDFFLQRKENHHCYLYLDSKLINPFDHDLVMLEITDYISSQVMKEYPHTPPEALKEVRRVMTFLFKVQNNTQVETLLEKEGIAIQSEDMDFPTPELGKEIPACWHHRLDQDIDNIFYPTEWVGYEDRENHIVFVQVGYPILPEDQTDLESIPRVGMKYKVYLSNKDQEGSDVSGLDLYKFIKGKSKTKVERTIDGDSQALAVYEGDPDKAEGQTPAFDAEYLKTIKEKLCKELREIWTLSEELRKKAIKRLYLKWHPDKNPDNPDFAEEIFKFLQSQIKRMEDGKTISSDDAPYSSGGTRSWFYDFGAWDNTAQDHYRWHRKEQSYHSSQHHSYSSASGFGGSSFFYESFQKNEEKNIQEGWRWIEQAEVDFGMLIANNTLAQEDPTLKGYALVCYLAHQVAEKALQGGVFAICGRDERHITDHNLSNRAYMIQARKLGKTIGLISHVTPMEKYYLDTRYPNRWQGYTDIPADHYTDSEAEKAVEHAKFVLEMVKALMPCMQ